MLERPGQVTGTQRDTTGHFGVIFRDEKKGSETFQNVPKPCSDVEVSLNCNIVDSNIEWH